MHLLKLSLVLWGCLTVLSSCSKDSDDDLGGGEKNSAISVKVEADRTLHIVGLTRAAGDVAEGDFRVRLENTKAEILATWKYDTIPGLIRVVPGSYKLVAWYGAELNELPVFDRPCYYGETKIKLKAGDNLDTTVMCKQASVKVAVKFDESFAYDYADYSVDIKTVGDSLHFDKTETRSGYFKPGDLRMRFYLRPIGSDTTYLFYPSQIANVKMQEFYNITLKSSSTNGAATITVQTDSSVIELPVDVDLPPFYMPKPAPKVKTIGFMSGETLTTTEGVGKASSVTIASAGGLTELILKTTSDTLISRGWPAELDLMKATKAQLDVLKRSGLEWTDNLVTQDTIKTIVVLRFDNVIRLLNTAETETTSAFELLVKDRFNQSGDAECKLNVNIAPPIFGFKDGAPIAGNVYAKKAEFDLTYTTERVGYIPTVQYKTEGGEWKSVVQEIKNESGERRIRVNGLNSVTPYVFRTVLGTHKSQEYTFTTEAELQVPNAGMEEWYEAWVKDVLWGANPFKKVKISCQQPASSAGSAYWSTINVKTGGGNPNVGSSFNTVPSTLSTEGRTGLGAKIQTVGWNNAGGNTDYSVGNAAAGRLFMGTYSYVHKDGPDVYNLGQSFVSRPSSLKFYYKYVPFGSDNFRVRIVVENRESGTIKIGEGEFVSGGTVETYTQKEVDVVYYNEKLKATHVYVIFESSDKADTSDDSEAKSRTRKISDPYPHWHGSDLYVDDIELVY